MNTDTRSTVRAEVTVDLPIAEAFALFTDGIGSWWNADHHIIEAPLRHMVFEPYVGGHVYDVGTDGSECRWSRVLVYDPPQRVVFSWDIDAHWQVETDPTRCSEVHVTFAEGEAGRTDVVLEHRHLDRHGPDLRAEIEGMREGWQGNLDDFAARAPRRG